jgi:exonuclease SbcD
VIIAHSSDWHLGFTRKGFNRTGANGRNQRQLDVLDAATAVVDQLHVLQPDLVLLAGDMLHSRKPDRKTVIDAERLFARLSEGLPHTLIVLIAGNHDMGTSGPAHCLLPLFAAENLQVVIGRPEWIRWRDAAVLAIPHPIVGIAGAVPHPQAAINVLLWHGALAGTGVTPGHTARNHSTDTITEPSAWSYIGLGDYHVAMPLWPNGGYCGSTEFTSSDPWSELRAGPKGFCSYNVATRERTWHPVPTRELVDLPRISAVDRTPEDLAEAITAAAVPFGEETIVRQVVTDAPSAVVGALESARRAITKQVFGYVLDVRRPERSVLAGAAHRQRYGSLEEILRESVAKWELSPGIDPTEFNAAAARYLSDAQELERKKEAADETPALPDESEAAA